MEFQLVDFVSLLHQGLATHSDLVAANESGKESLVEWVDGYLVEKARGYEASVVAVAIL